MKENHEKRRKISTAVWYAAGIVFWIVLWLIVSLAVGKEIILPSPASVAKEFVRLLGTGDFYLSLLRSFASIIAGFLAGNMLGVVLGTFAGLSKPFRAFMSPAMTVIKATPVASFIIIVLIWLGKALTPAFISFLIVLPIVWQNVMSGFDSADPGLLEMARVFEFSTWRKIRYIYAPAASESYAAAVKTSMGLAWKAGVAAEVLAGTAKTLGGQIYSTKVYLEVPQLFAWTVAVIVFSLLIELAASSVVKLAGRRGKSGNNRKSEEAEKGAEKSAEAGQNTGSDETGKASANPEITEIPEGGAPHEP
ncbi:MAG: ABC transporter permease subunit [Clostridia bacterium]|nr:ABC transporter permease subunit [Clostridia bacterium]